MITIRNRAKINRRVEITTSVMTGLPLNTVSQNIQYDDQLNTINRTTTVNLQINTVESVHRNRYGDTDTRSSSGFINSSTKYTRDPDSYNIEQVQVITNIPVNLDDITT